MVYVFLAEGFEEVEALTPVDVLRRCGVDVKTVGIGGKTITGSHKIPVTADLTENELTFDGLEAVILPGGMPGTLNLEKNQTVQQYLSYANSKELFICAICAAPSILGHNGMLTGLKATCFPGFEKDLLGAEVKSDLAVADGIFITGKGEGAAMEFALLIAENLCGKEVSEKTRKSLQCQ